MGKIILTDIFEVGFHGENFLRAEFGEVTHPSASAAHIQFIHPQKLARTRQLLTLF